MQKRQPAGFTLVEVLVVFALFAILGGFGLFASMDTFRGSHFRTDRDLLVAVLMRARAQAMHNVCVGSNCADGQPHGVHIDPDGYVLFQGAVYDSTDPLNARFPANSAIQHSGYLTRYDVVFSQLSGDASCGGVCEITLKEGTHTSTITVTGAGRIHWTN